MRTEGYNFQNYVQTYPCLGFRFFGTGAVERAGTAYLCLSWYLYFLSNPVPPGSPEEVFSRLRAEDPENRCHS